MDAGLHTRELTARPFSILDLHPTPPVSPSENARIKIVYVLNRYSRSHARRNKASQHERPHRMVLLTKAHSPPCLNHPSTLVEVHLRTPIYPHPIPRRHATLRARTRRTAPHLRIPVRKAPHHRILTASHQKQGHHLPRPQPAQPCPRVSQPTARKKEKNTSLTPAKMERERKPDRQREHVVRDDIECRAKVLPALPAQHAAARVGEPVCDLRGRGAVLAALGGELGEARHTWKDATYGMMRATCAATVRSGLKRKANAWGASAGGSGTAPSGGYARCGRRGARS